jgi:hypothetical protein
MVCCVHPPYLFVQQTQNQTLQVNKKAEKSLWLKNSTETNRTTTTPATQLEWNRFYNYTHFYLSVFGSSVPKRNNNNNNDIVL